VAWDSLASTYDVVAAKYEARFIDELRDKPFDRELLTGFAKSTVDPIAEIGCGPGHIGAFVAQWGRRVFGVDLSPYMARRADVRLAFAMVADMRSLPLPDDSLGGLLAFYSVIHVRRTELAPVLAEFCRVVAPGGHVLFSAHEGEGELERDQFLDESVPVVATLFDLDELVDASRAAGLEVTVAERRTPYESELDTVRLYVQARKPDTTGHEDEAIP
jgi:SAM-dependent methyltransferase